MPNARSRFASVEPTPASDETSRASSSCGGVQPRGRGHSCWTTPVKPVCIRVIVATRTEDRTRSGRHALRGVLEPEEADGAGTRVRADDGAEGGRDLDLRLRTDVRDELAERLDPLRRERVGDADLERRRVGRRRLEQVAELGERLLVAAN